jgi:putative membrane protein
MTIVLHLAVLAASILLLARFLPGVRIRSAWSAVVVAITFSVLNFFLGWLISALLFVPAVLTLGVLLFFIPFIVNAILLWMTDKLLASFEIENVGALLVAAVVITLVNDVFYAPLLHAVSAGRFHAGSPHWI